MTVSDKFDLALRGLPIIDLPAQWKSGPTTWEGTVSLVTHGPDIAIGARRGAPGNLGMPERVEFTFTGTHLAPTIRATVEVVHNVAQLTSITFAGGRWTGIQTSDLRNVSVDMLVSDIADRTSIAVRETAPGSSIWEQVDPEPREAGRSVDKRPRMRRGRPYRRSELIIAAADIYREHQHGRRPLATVAEQMNVSPRTAARYVQLAREQKLLSPRPAGKIVGKRE